MNNRTGAGSNEEQTNISKRYSVDCSSSDATRYIKEEEISTIFNFYD